MDCFRDSLEDLLVDIFGFLFGVFFFGSVGEGILWRSSDMFFVDLCLNFWSKFRGFRGFMQHNSESKLHKL